MKHIQLIKELELKGTVRSDEPKAQEIYNAPHRRILEIVLQEGATLAKHKANEPITVLCLAGEGVFRAGDELEDEIDMRPGTLITLETGIPHEAVAGSGLRLLVTRIKDF